MLATARRSAPPFSPQSTPRGPAVRLAAFANLTHGGADPGRLEGGGCTHVGHVREHNEDAWLSSPSAGLFAVADGMGGHAAGEVASALCIRALATLAAQPVPTADKAFALRATLERANREISAAGLSDASRLGMGTTVAALWLDGARAVIAHVGDSRVYRLRDGVLTALTLDHSLLGDAVRSGWITEAQAREQPPSCVITRALGTQPGVDVEIGATSVLPGDRFVLSSDGLTDLVHDMQIQRIVRATPSPAEAARQLTLAALDAGGLDNVTVVVVQAG